MVGLSNECRVICNKNKQRAIFDLIKQQNATIFQQDEKALPDAWQDVVF